MQSAHRGLVSAFLLLATLIFYSGCGGGGDGSGDTPAAATPVGSAPVSPPATTPPPEPAPPAPPAENGAPSIAVDSGNEARVGVNFELTPAASDPENDPLTFSAENLPPWASIDPASGRISGTPAAADVGAHEDITITVADGAHRVAAAPVSITVTANGSGVAALTWQRPMSKVDGSSLDDLAGYRIRYGRDPEDLDHSVFIDDPARTSYEFATLDAGVWYFAVVGINAAGLEGPPTTAASKSI